jgi:hypothetical protein
LCLEQNLQKFSRVVIVFHYENVDTLKRIGHIRLLTHDAFWRGPLARNALRSACSQFGAGNAFCRLYGFILTGTGCRLARRPSVEFYTDSTTDLRKPGYRIDDKANQGDET